MVRLVHATSTGRARYRIRELHRSNGLKSYLERELSREGEVNHVFANPSTGKVFLLLNARVNPGDVGRRIELLLERYRAAGKPLPTVVKRGSPAAAGSARRKPAPQSAPARAARYAGRILRRLRDVLPHRTAPPSLPWHTLPADTALAALGTSASSGLNESAAGEARRRHGPNELPLSAPRARLAVLAGQFKSLPVLLLGAAALLSLASGGVADAVAILCVVGINAAVGFVTESATERTIRGLQNLVRPSAAVVRDGRPRDLPVEEVVPGDILVFRPGAYVAADVRLLEAQHLSVDESVLTGESMPALKDEADLVAEEAPVADRVNMAFMGTQVTGGQGKGVAVATGRSTEVGNLQALLSEAGPPPTALESELRQAANRLVVLTGAVCGLVLGVGLLRGYGLLTMLRTTISLAIAAVPEGLPAVAITTLALGMRRMRRHGILIRKLEAVETLGAIQVLCLDKTGTITLNRMAVRRIAAGGEALSVETANGVSPAEPLRLGRVAVRLLEAACLCNEAQVVQRNGALELRGSPTEKALLELAVRAGVDVVRLRDEHPLLEIQHRNESSNVMRTLHRGASGRLLAIKGSPLEVLALCDSALHGESTAPLEETDRRRIEAENDRMAGESLRVLGVAVCSEDCHGAPAPRCTWLGLVGMADPIRPGVPALIRTFHQAGIETVMITGDQTPTAFAVGRELGLSRGAPLEILESTRLAGIGPELMAALSRQVHVFARVSPAHKLRIVQALQEGGRVVAMTGDGINDGPALKAADIGIAMGKSGTDIARDVAQVVLEKDDLATLALAVSHGRTTHANIRKSLRFLLSTNFSEVLVTLAAVGLNLGRPLNALQLLWINLVSDIFPSLALALEPPEPEVMQQPPRDRREPVLSARDLSRMGLESAAISAGSLAAYGWGLARHGQGSRASALAFHGLVLGQLLHALHCRTARPGSRRPAPNPALLAALGGSFLLQGAAQLVPGLRALLGLERMGAVGAGVAAGGALLGFALNGLALSRRARGAGP